MRRITLISTVVMILRVRALYSRSRIIRGVLLVFYAIENIVNLAYCIWVSTQRGRSLGT